MFWKEAWGSQKPPDMLVNVIALGAVTPACSGEKLAAHRNHRIFGMLVNVIALGAVTPVVFWREACGSQKPPDIRHAGKCDRIGGGDSGGLLERSLRLTETTRYSACW
jgi:hypothetical protein